MDAGCQYRDFFWRRENFIKASYEFNNEATSLDNGSHAHDDKMKAKITYIGMSTGTYLIVIMTDTKYKKQTVMPMPQDIVPPRAQVDDKYMYSVDNKDGGLHGWISSGPPDPAVVGFWLVFPSPEFCSGGPTKQNLTNHTGPSCLAVRVNNPKSERPLFEVADLGMDNTIGRHGIHGLYQLLSVDVPSALLIKGDNIVYLTQANAGNQFV
ncbi:hypothetical protein QJS10_CPA09g00754 [Acorus calamus]|uniref:Rhamnogalacturonan lyase domain-containing protein n=1 Tax=Acorus calamus TaxID=4465 RepID=A0AAV9E6A4_ACOCL|nr:hypothetical protein QJS10_CPA09g00754 [Acorus calamus]